MDFFIIGMGLVQIVSAITMRLSSKNIQMATDTINMLEGNTMTRSKASVFFLVLSYIFICTGTFFIVLGVVI